MALNEQNFKVENNWWMRQLQDYQHLDSLTEEDFKRLTLCALRYIIETFQFIFENNQPERSKREDLDKLDSDWRKLTSDLRKLGCGALNTQETE